MKPSTILQPTSLCDWYVNLFYYYH